MRWELPVLAALIALGIALEALGVVDWRLALEWARGHAGGWQLPATIVLAQLALYTFAQPGSIPLLEVLGPLILIALLLLLGRFALRQAARKRGAPSPGAK